MIRQQLMCVMVMGAWFVAVESHANPPQPTAAVEDTSVLIEKSLYPVFRKFVDFQSLCLKHNEIAQKADDFLRPPFERQQLTLQAMAMRSEVLEARVVLGKAIAGLGNGAVKGIALKSDPTVPVSLGQYLYGSLDMLHTLEQRLVFSEILETRTRGEMQRAQLLSASFLKLIIRESAYYQKLPTPQAGP